MRQTPSIIGGPAAATLLLAACGSGGSTAATTSAAGTTAGGASSAGASNGAAEAKAYLDSVSGNPPGIGIDIPLSKKPDAGKYIINLTTAEPVAKIKSDAEAAAAKALGWRYESILVGSTAEGPSDALNSAITKKPDGISFSGVPSSAFGSALTEAASTNIPLLADTVVEPAKAPVISTALDNDVQIANWGKMVAAQFVVDSNGKGNAAVFTITQYPILVAWQDAVKAGVAQWCPDCKLKLENVMAGDIGTKLPGQVVSALQADPSIKYAMFSIGDETIGLSSALSGASMSGIKVLGETPSVANIQALKDKKEVGWTGFPTIMLGWRIMDMWARHFNGDDLEPANKALLPLQVLTQDNVGSAVITPEGYYVGYADYAAAFEKLWLLSG